ncbi:unnamed protein product [Danaus chrysippus]|uniref:(African queen) hypothetical protein n=1 Tax=Danaus chrysippus TaxID=151541 RepID=A0A8J2W1E7_9NEOP|nr:unnamed protein product [Danaus chrysippus]
MLLESECAHYESEAVPACANLGGEAEHAPTCQIYRMRENSTPGSMGTYRRIVWGTHTNSWSAEQSRERGTRSEPGLLGSWGIETVRDQDLVYSLDYDGRLCVVNN